jgi:Ca-activated chloride channel family protein
MSALSRPGIFARFGHPAVGLVALSLLAGACSRNSAPAEAPPETTAMLRDAQPVPEAASPLAPLAPPAPPAAEAAVAAPTAGPAEKKSQARGASAAPRTLAFRAPAPTTAPIVRDAPINTEDYAPIAENTFLAVASQPLSTFSIDVDTASYSNSRRFLAAGKLPPKDAIRIEEWVNYFAYDYAPPTGSTPFAVSTEVTSCPWNAAHELVRIGIKGQEIREENVPARNLVFLLDVSGSMMTPDKLPLVKRGLAMMTENLRPQDSIAIVVYAGSSGLVLPATSGRERGKILRALEGLEAGGSTNGGEGIELAYAVAQQQFKKGGINRVILATDGDFNVGTTSQGELTRLIENKRKSGIFLTVLGFGTGNTKDSTMEMLADKGNGNYAYIDTLTEARKVLVREAGSTLVTIAKDVKLQVEMNPLKVASYKLIGYENRLLAKEDFNDDKKDAGEIGAGHTVTALYEIVPKGAAAPATPAGDALKYQAPGAPSPAASSSELMTVSVRYKLPQADVSTKLSVVVADASKPIEQASDDYRFGVAVANVALVLRGSPDVKQSSLDSARSMAGGAVGPDVHGDRREFLAMVDEARRLRGGQSALKTVVR